jgi:hypothetical protein
MAKSSYRFRHLYWIVPLNLAWIMLAIVLVLLVHWLEGGEFHSLVEQKAAERLHAKAELAPIHWDWVGLTSGSLRALGSAETALKKIESSGLHARIHPAALLQGHLVVEKITLDRSEVRLGPVKEGNNKVVAEGSTQPSILPKWLPTQFVIEKIESCSTDVLIEQPKGGSFDILGTRLESVPEGDQIRFEAHGGRLVSEHFPALKIAIETIRCRLSHSGLDLTGADLSIQNGGTLRLEGNFPSNGSESRLKGHWEKVELSSLLPALEGRVVGSLEGQGEAAWGSDGIHAISGNVRAHGITLSQIPALEKLALVTAMDQFRHLPIQEAHATFSGDANKTTWSDVVLESKGLLKLIGDAEVGQEGSLMGSFQVGITKRIVDMIPFAREVLGLNEHDGYIWIPMMVGGSLSHPVEDLSPRLASLFTVRAEGVIKEGIQQGMKFLGIKEQSATNMPSTNAVRTLEQEAGKVLDTLGGFLK